MFPQKTNFEAKFMSTQKPNEFKSWIKDWIFYEWNFYAPKQVETEKHTRSYEKI